MTTQAQDLLERIERFDKSDRSIVLKQPATLIVYLPDSARWGIGKLAAAGDSVDVQASVIPVSAPQSEVEAILDRIPAPGPEIIDPRALTQAINEVIMIPRRSRTVRSEAAGVKIFYVPNIGEWAIGLNEVRAGELVSLRPEEVLVQQPRSVVEKIVRQLIPDPLAPEPTRKGESPTPITDKLLERLRRMTG